MPTFHMPLNVIDPRGGAATFCRCSLCHDRADPDHSRSMQHDPLPERGREVDEARQPTGSKNVRASTANPATRAHPGGVTAWRVGKAIIAFAAALVIYL